MYRFQDILVLAIAALMDRNRLWLVQPINLDGKGIELDPQLGRGPVSGHTVAVGFHFDLAEAIEVGLDDPTALQVVGRQGTQLGLLLLPGRANRLWLPVNPPLIIFQAGLP